MRGVLCFCLLTLGAGTVAAADPYDAALEARVARLEALVARRVPRERALGPAARWKGNLPGLKAGLRRQGRP